MGTLTGAARVALGPELPPYYTDDDALAAEVARHAAAENDPLWRLPLWPRYDSMLNSKMADLNNVASGGFAGSIVCALFLGASCRAAKSFGFTSTFMPGRRRRSPARPEGGECQAARAVYALLKRAVRLMPAFDPRLTPARPDLAAAIYGARSRPRASSTAPSRSDRRPDAVRDGPSHGATAITEALMGERVTVYETDDEGWAWGQLAADGYVGWIPVAALLTPGAAPTHKVAALRTLVFPGPSIKLPPADALPLGAHVAVAREQDSFAVTASGGYVPKPHLAPIAAK